MSERLNQEPTGQNNGEAWEGLAEAVAQFKQEQKDTAPERAKRHFEEIRDIELDFAKRNASIAETGDEMSKKEFETWEDAISDELEIGEEEIRTGEMNLSKRAEVMQYMVTYRVDSELHKTVEARAGDYYHERDAALRDAIREQGGEDAEKDLAYLNGFYPAVAHHLDYKYMTPSDVNDIGSEAYERERTRAHNDAIRYLNGLNRLAHKYDTRPFTVRDFWTSDLCDKRGQTPAIASVMRYDRDIVEEYYAIAFSSDVRSREAQAARARRYGL